MSGENLATESFLRAARHRLWLLQAVWVASIGLWAAGLLLAVLGIAHVLAMPVPPWLPVATILAVAVGSAITIILRRPPLSVAAARADRAFGGRAVMATALECLSGKQSPASPAGRIVLGQAREAACAWQPQLRRRLRWEPHAAGAAVLIPLFVGVLLLAQPGAEPTTGAAEDTGVEAANAPDPASNAEQLDDLATLRRELAAAQPEPQFTAAQTDAAGSRAQPVDAAGNPGADERPNGVAGNRMANTTGDAAGDARPNDSERSMTSAELEAGTSIGIVRDGGRGAASTATRRPYERVNAALEYTTVEALPAAPPESAGATVFMSPSRAAYAARYLEERGVTDD